MKNITFKNVTLYVSGTHCASCKIAIEDFLNEQSGIKNAKVNLKHEIVSFDIEASLDKYEIANDLNEKLKHLGYTFYVDEEEKKKIEKSKKEDKEVLWQALPLGIAILALFFLLQKSGILDFGIGGSVSPVTSFIVGLVASVSSCLAVVGGLVLSLSATFSLDNKDDTKPIYLFHIGRLLAFALLGGVLGLFGQIINLGFTFGAVLGVLSSIVMILLGLNLVGIFDKNIVTLPSGVFAFFQKVEHKTFAPLFLGIGTFFLPCGFTQTMQIAALSSGSFMSGMLIMLGFALGTLPMLALISFGSTSLAKGKYAQLFFKSSGVVVIGLGIFTLYSGLVALGFVDPIFNI